MIVESSLPQVNWPAVPAQGPAQLLAALHQLEQTQWWSPDRLLDHQLEQLGQLTAFAYDTVPYYRRVFDEQGLDPRAAWTPERWRQIPLLSRQDLQRHEEALISTQIPKTHGSTDKKVTSGSTGASVAVLHTKLDAYFWSAITIRDHLWERRDFMGKLAVIRFFPARTMADPPFGQRQEHWGRPWESVFRTGPMVVLAIRADPYDQLDWLLREQPDYLLTYPTNLEALADAMDGSGASLHGLQQLRTCSEAIDEGIRQRCREVFGVKVSDMYSTQEVGYVALQCPDHEHYHVQSENVLVEVLDDSGRPCEPGQVGRVVVTPLHNFATVLFRYDVGDYAEVGSPCPCGRGLPVLKRVLGRVRNMVTYPNGKRAWVNFIAFKSCRDTVPVRQTQIVQTSVHDMEVKLVTDQPLTPVQEHDLAERLLKDLEHPFTLRFTYHAALLREASGKFEDFRSLVPPPGR
jgi:phenylacetate-coenzyme A ligase PaaK-like adenylate-forming protein